MALKILYFGSDKPSSVEGLRVLVELGHVVLGVVGPDIKRPSLGSQSLFEMARRVGVPMITPQEVDELNVRKDVDLLISFLYSQKLDESLLAIPRLGAINIHNAPLPEFRGVGGYNHAILQGLEEWGVTAHFMDKNLDTGDIIHVRRFPIDPEKETALSLDQLSQEPMLECLRFVMEKLQKGESLDRLKQDQGTYYSKKDLERHRKILLTDSQETVLRKIRAFWYPPYSGATIEINGLEVSLVSESILKSLGCLIHGSSEIGGK